MRIALLYLDGLDIGGYPRDVRWLASALVRHGHDVALVARKGDQTDGLDGVEVVMPKGFTSLYQAVDLVHSWGLFVPSQMLLESAGRKKRPGVPSVLSPLAQLMPLHLGRSVWKKVPYLALLRPALRGARLVAHFFSEEEYWASLRYLQPAGHFEASLGLFPPPVGVTPGEGDRDYLLFFGRNDITQKGLDVLVEGYRYALRKGLDIPLVVAGHPDKGSLAYWSKVVSDPELAAHVELVGEVSDSDKARLLADARCLVFPSRWDGPPRPIREAIALGTPVIVTNGTNMGHLVEEHGAGELVALEPSSVAEGLLSAADAEVVSHWRKGVSRLQVSLSWESVAASYVEGYSMALKKLGQDR